MGLLYDGIRLAEMAGRAGSRNTPQQAPAEPEPPPPNPLDSLIYGPGAIAPGEQPDPTPEHTPGDLKFILDETDQFMARYVDVTEAQRHAMMLYAMATWALRAFPAFGRMLFRGEKEESGKTLAMELTAALSSNPLDVGGTNPALNSTLAAAHNAPEQPPPTLYYDEISTLFGRSGLNATRSQIADVLRRGYKAKATNQWSVNRVNEKFSIFTPFLMTGLAVAVPRDIRSRCIVIAMEPGRPWKYFDVREAEPEAEALAAAIRQHVGSRMPELAAFRARGVHPRLVNRKLEVWEPLFAVAWVLGGQEWLNKCRNAFKELALSEADQATLSPRQQILRDAAGLLKGSLADMAASGFVGGLALADEMLRLDNPLYAGRTLAGISQLISEAMPCPSTQKRALWAEGKPVRGYFTHEIADAWEAVRPPDAEDAEIGDEENPFDVTDDTEAVTDDTDENLDLTSPVTPVTPVTDDSEDEPAPCPVLRRPAATVLSGGYRAALLSIPTHDELDDMARTAIDG